jgi:putative protease
MIQTELLAPAGSPEALDAAIAEGADAVYLGLKDFNARMRSANFSYAQFEGALRSLHRMGRKLYVTVNTVFQQREADRVYQLLKYLAGLGPDGILVQDFGVITMARENFPSLKLHASTQMNVASARGLNLLSRHGFSRAVLARELSLAEIQEIRANTNMELEIFVHGALCVSVSGLCLFSSYLGGKSANRGMCAQACRRFYTAYRGKGTEETVGEGGFYFSPSDLELIAEIPALAAAGVNVFKIEGRMKSAEYVGAVVSAYRLVIDNLESGEENLRRAIAEARGLLRNDFARSKTAYLLNSSAGIPGNTGIDWLNPKQSGGTGIPLGVLLKTKGRGEEKRGLISSGAIVPVVGDSIRLHRADDSDRISHKIFSVEAGPKGDHWISIPETFAPGDAVYLIQTRSLKRYARLIKRESSSRLPGRDRAPLPATESRGKAELPEGLYVVVNRIEDLYLIQSKRPVRVILPYSRKTARQLLDGKGLPFPPREIILSLDPFFPQEMEGELAEKIPALMEKGYSQFIVNNLGHFSLLRAKDERKKALVIAGPWLYTFNAWAWDFIRRCGADYNVSPLENNRQNVEKTFFAQLRSRVFITVFVRPSIFRIRQDLRAHYDFENFTGNKDEAFFLSPGAEGSLVYPWLPFSIIDKIPFLREAGFNRFILDFSDHPLKKVEYRDIMDAADRFSPMPGASRFNWKNGFFKTPSA